MYIPAGVFGKTDTVPSGFSTTPPVGVVWKTVFTVKFTSAGKIGVPFSVSLSSTFNTVVTPTSPSTGFVVSFTASIVLEFVGSSTIIVTTALSQLVGLAISHI
ncbi:hypothetical protein FLGE108171_02735 [Flavobacterium gelidilacus]